MAANQRQPRERSHLQREGWSDWVQAMVPWVPRAPGFPTGSNPRGDQPGLICSSNIQTALSSYARHCGIYEWQARGILPNQPNYVVYVGSTCRGKPGALKGRIQEYCRNGSHKSVLINDALWRGYELWVRVKIVEGSNPSKEKAQDMENALLNKYDYAWNTRINGQIRNILL